MKYVDLLKFSFYSSLVDVLQQQLHYPRASALPWRRQRGARLSEQHRMGSVGCPPPPTPCNPPACLHPTVSALPARTAELSRCTAQSHSHLSVLLCCTVHRAQPSPTTHQVPAASGDRGSNPDSIKVQRCHKTQETGLNSWILNGKPPPAVRHPLGPRARPCNSLLSAAFPGEGGWKRHCCSASPPSPGVNQLGDTSGHIPRPASPDGCPVRHPPSICLQRWYQLCPGQGQDQH